MVMANWQLPEDLERLEHRLMQRPREEPSVALRDRVMVSVPTALRRQRSGGTWRMFATVAAGVLIWLNLSFSAANSTNGTLRPHGRRESGDRMARQIERLLPDLPYEEARRHAIRYRSGSELVPCPEVSARPMSDSVLTGSSG